MTAFGISIRLIYSRIVIFVKNCAMADAKACAAIALNNILANSKQ